MDISTRSGIDMSMAQLKKCPYCKGAHRKKSAYLRCARKNAPMPSWERINRR